MIDRILTLGSSALALVRAGAGMLRNRTERERICAVSVFALIFASLAGGVDFVVTGGADFAPSAAEASTLLPAPRMPAPTPAPDDAVAVEEDVPELTITEVGYDLTIEDLLGGPEAALDELPSLSPAQLLAEMSDAAAPAPAKGKPAGI